MKVCRSRARTSLLFIGNKRQTDVAVPCLLPLRRENLRSDDTRWRRTLAAPVIFRVFAR